MKFFTPFFVFLLLLLNGSCFSQDLLNAISNPDGETAKATAAFKSSRVVIGQSIENPHNGDLNFVISHHFGALNSGYENLFGLKEAYVRIGFDYGINSRLAVGYGLSAFENTWDISAKYKLLEQQTGKRNIPLSVSLFASAAVETLPWKDTSVSYPFVNRLSYAYQILVARKFSKNLTLQLMPEMVHKNYVQTEADHNDIFALGFGGRMKFSKRASVNAEYHYVFPDQIHWKHYNSFSVGLDLETGGHVFQLFVTNSMGAIAQSFIPGTFSVPETGSFFFGFNISRVFTLKKNKSW